MFLSFGHDFLIIANQNRCLAPVAAQGQGVAQGFDGCLPVPETKATRKGQNGIFLGFPGP